MSRRDAGVDVGESHAGEVLAENCPLALIGDNRALAAVVAERRAGVDADRAIVVAEFERDRD